MKSRYSCWNKSRWVFVIIEILAFLVMLYLTHREPLTSDDFRLSMARGDESPLMFAVQSGMAYYRNSGGRAIVNGIRGFLLLTDKWIYDILNALMYGCFATLIYAFAYPRPLTSDKRSNILLILIYCLLWMFIPGFGGIVLWLTGSVVYLWPAVVFLGFLLIYYRRFTEQENENPDTNVHSASSVIKCTGMLFLGFLAGCSIEPDACALMLVLLLWLIYMRRSKKTIYPWEVVGGIAAIAGFVFLFASPGIRIRGRDVTESEVLLIRYGYRVLRETYYAGKYLLVPVGLALGALFFARVSRKEARGELALLFTAFAGIYVMTFSSGFAVRVLFVPVALVVASLGVSLRRIREQIPWQACVAVVASLVLVTTLQIFTAVVTTSPTNSPLRRDTIYTAPNAENLFSSGYGAE